MGYQGREFRIYKFRSMIVNADTRGAVVTVRQDDRVTRVGRTIRRWKIDELPNLINVVLGDMSLVGPRPESPAMLKRYTPEQKIVFSVRPGIACLAQIRYPNEQALLQGSTLDESAYLVHMQNKLELDMLYVRTATLSGDLLILVCTILALIGIQIDLESFFRARLSPGSSGTT